MASEVINKLWPNQRGGVEFLFGNKMTRALGQMALECKRRDLPCTFRIKREGLHYIFEPMEA